jgi:hypothetical protein
MFCSKCGTKAPDITAKFCHNCGAMLPQIASDAAPSATEESLDIQVPIDDFKVVPARSYGQVPLQETAAPEPLQPPVSQPPAYQPEQTFTQSSTAPYSSSNDPSDGHEEDDRPFWQKPVFIIIGAGLFFAFLAWGLKDFWAAPKKPEPQSMTPSTTGEAPVIDESETQTYYAVRKLKVRSKPSTDASILTEIARGAQIEGTLVNGPDGKSRWIKVKGKEQYIAEVNLSDVAPEAMQTALNRVLTLDEQTEIRNRPADNGTTVDTLAAGGKVEALGIVNGWVEIALKKGGVGYIRPSEASTNAVATLGTGAAKPAVAAASAVDFGSMIAFNAESCTFGSGIDSVMSALSSNQGKGPFTVPGVEGELTGKADNPSDPTSGKIRTAVKGNYKGLTLTGIYSAYEGNGLTFADSPDKVAAAFADAGFQKDENGGYATSQDGGGGFISSEGGKSVLSCGQ